MCNYELGIKTLAFNLLSCINFAKQHGYMCHNLDELKKLLEEIRDIIENNLYEEKGEQCIEHFKSLGSIFGEPNNIVGNNKDAEPEVLSQEENLESEKILSEANNNETTNTSSTNNEKVEILPQENNMFSYLKYDPVLVIAALIPMQEDLTSLGGEVLIDETAWNNSENYFNYVSIFRRISEKLNDLICSISLNVVQVSEDEKNSLSIAMDKIKSCIKALRKVYNKRNTVDKIDFTDLLKEYELLSNQIIDYVLISSKSMLNNKKCI